MLELNPNGGDAPAGDLIKDATEATFMADVIDASQEVPVIVDFWATWCGPCKTLGPMLETAVKAARGKVRMVKVDVDAEQRLAAALAQQGLPLQSIPTVVAFHEGRPVDMFQGAVPQSEITAFIDKLSALAGDGGLGEALEAAEAMLAEGAAAGQADQAEALLANATEDIATAPEIEAARAQLELARQAESAGPVADLKAAVDADPDNHQARMDLAQALYAAGDAEEAVDQLLELFRRDREWNDGAAKAQLFTMFEALKPEDPVALNGRRKLSSMIFA